MEAIEFLQEYRRMCNSYQHCGGCPLKEAGCLASGMRLKSDSKFLTITSTVEQWSKEHPVMTNAQKFEEVFGSVPSHKISSSWSTTNTANESRILTEDYIGINVDWWDEPYKEPENA